MNDTRARLVTSTNELFRRRGYHGTGVKDVVTAAQATNGSLYHFFPGGKAELTAAVLTESGESYRLLFEAIADEAPDAVAAIRAFFDGAAEVLEAIDFVDTCPIGTVAREVASVDEPLRRTCAAVFESWSASAARRFEAEGLEGAEARRLADVAVAALEGAILLGRTHRDASVVHDAGGVVADAVEAALLRAARTNRRTRSRAATF